MYFFVNELLVILVFIRRSKAQDTMAKDVFLNVGNELQKRRVQDFTDNIWSTLKEPLRYTTHLSIFCNIHNDTSDKCQDTVNIGHRSDKGGELIDM